MIDAVNSTIGVTARAMPTRDGASRFHASRTARHRKTQQLRAETRRPSRSAVKGPSVRSIARPGSTYGSGW